MRRDSLFKKVEMLGLTIKPVNVRELMDEIYCPRKSILLKTKSDAPEVFSPERHNYINNYKIINGKLREYFGKGLELPRKCSNEEGAKKTLDA